MSNRIQEAFDRVEASEELKTATLRFVEKERLKNETKRKPAFHPAFVSWKNIAAAACGILMLLLFQGSCQMVKTPVSYVSIDVNPSVELSLNRFDRVIAANAYNEDGELLIRELRVTGKTCQDAVNDIVTMDAMKPYLTKESSLTFTVASHDAEKERVILAEIENSPACRNHGGQSYAADVDTVQEAHGHGLSLGKYAAYLTLSQYEDTVSPEDCHNMTMSEIHARIREHEECESGNPSHVHEKGHGAAHSE